MKPAISVKSLSKIYRVWKQPRDLLIEGLTGRVRHSEFQALTDVSFDIPKGSVVGLMGRNGAGKSTLLRIVAGTLDSSGGSSDTVGRIAAILELGTGFHPDYTGRENVFLGGLCLGLSRREIEERFDEIVDFAELWDFIDNPFRTYSSGMQARLTFAVATCIDPDILIIDEALGVGDARFQLKSFDRIRQFKERGKSILLVSHNIGQIVAICDRAILIDKGRVLEDGDPNKVGNVYHELLFAPAQQLVRIGPTDPNSNISGGSVDEVHDSRAEVAAEANFPAQGEALASEGSPVERSDASDDLSIVPPVDDRKQRYGLRQVEILDVGIEDSGGRQTTFLKSLGTYQIVMRIKAKQESGGAPRIFDDLDLGFLVRDTKGIEVFGWDTANSLVGPIRPLASGEERVEKLVFKANLSGGDFFLTSAVAHRDKTKQDMWFDSLPFTIAPTPHVFTASLVNLEMRLVDALSGHAINGPFDGAS